MTGAAAPPVVVDTNVFVAAAFRPGSDSAQVLAAVRAGALRLVWNEPTRAETERILRRIPRLSWDAVAPLFGAAGRHAGAVDPASFAAVPGVADREFAALATAAGATLVTLDRPLLAAGAQGEFRALAPGELVDREGLGER